MKKLCFLLPFLFCQSVLFAQYTPAEERTGTRVIASYDFLIGVPSGDFAKNQIRTSYGFAGNLLFEVREPVSIGIDVGWQQYDKENDFFTEIGDDGFEYLTEEETKNNILTFSGVIRAQPQVNFPLKPYLEGQFGTNFFYTRTVFSDADSDEQLDSRTDRTEWALTYGGAAGVMVNLWGDLLFLDLKCVYRRGNNATYYVRDEDLNNRVPLDNFELKTSPTDILIPQIGVAFYLSEGKGKEQPADNYDYEEDLQP